MTPEEIEAVRKTKRIDVVYSSDFPRRPWGTLAEWHAWLDEIAALVPEEFRSAVELSIAGDSEGYTSTDCEYTRPETDAEVVERVQRERWAATNAAVVEHDTYLRLKAKYEGRA